MTGLLGEFPLAAGEGSFWMPPKGSTVAVEVDQVFYFIFYVSAFFFLLIAGLTIFFVIRYRRRAGVEPGQTAHHNLALELTWSGIPLVLVCAMFYLGMKAMINFETPPSRARSRAGRSSRRSLASSGRRSPVVFDSGSTARSRVVSSDGSRLSRMPASLERR